MIPVNVALEFFFAGVGAAVFCISLGLLFGKPWLDGWQRRIAARAQAKANNGTTKQPMQQSNPPKNVGGLTQAQQPAGGA